MTITFRPAVRENTPLIIGLAGPTKSGKTFSSHRLAIGLANGGTVAMINTEGPRGHAYAERFKYVACDLEPPYRATAYIDALDAAKTINPAVVIIDSGSHMHDGPGGTLEWHSEELDRLAGQDQGKRDRNNFTAWIRPKAAENAFIYSMLGMKCPVILALRAKEKLKIMPGKPPVDLGWQPIIGERIAFETIFTLVLPPHSKGVPDLSISEMREPFDTMVPSGRPIDEDLGRNLAAWAAGGIAKPTAPTVAAPPLKLVSPPSAPSGDRAALLAEITNLGNAKNMKSAARTALWEKHVGADFDSDTAPLDKLTALKSALDG